MAIMEISVNPLGTGNASVASYVARSIEALKAEKDVKYTTTSMCTIVEGEIGQLLKIAQKMHDAVLAAGVNRVITLVKIDDRRDKSSTMQGKMESLRREMKQPG